MAKRIDYRSDIELLGSVKESSGVERELESLLDYRYISFSLKILHRQDCSDQTGRNVFHPPKWCLKTMVSDLLRVVVTIKSWSQGRLSLRIPIVQPRKSLTAQ
ncbi:hypothetical protein ACS0PU_012453 [Formica fusca]